MVSAQTPQPFDIPPLETWFPGLTRPLVIAGPCSAETEEQVLRTAEAVRGMRQVQVFRAGLWKPRTRPGMFQGVGDDGLAWLAKAGRETGLLTACEVATPDHVKASLDEGIDILWVGARTTTSPFAVGELAEALAGSGAAVLVKNPMNPDNSLWLGAIERLYRTGLRRLGVIHRGFNALGETRWRNAPLWELPIDLEKDHPELPIFCDPSHIAGRRDLVGDICQKACDLEMDGLMIESHIDPSAALTDRDQQLAPAALSELLSGLVFRDPREEDSEFRRRMDALRMVVDEVDETIISALGRRFNIVREMGQVKKERGATILQAPRWREVVKSRLRMGEARGLRPDFLEDILHRIHEEAIDIQERILNPHKREEKQR